MAKQLLHPDLLNEGLRSGLFISERRFTGKAILLRHDLIPALEQEGAVVIYVDLWSGTQSNLAKPVSNAIRQALEELQTAGLVAACTARAGQRCQVTETDTKPGTKS